MNRNHAAFWSAPPSTQENRYNTTFTHSEEVINLAVKTNYIFRKTAKEVQLKLLKNKTKKTTDDNWFDADC